MDMKSIKAWKNQAFAQIILAAIMAFMVVTILIIVMLPVLSGIMKATPVYVTNPIDVGNSTGGAVHILGTAAQNATQVTLANTLGSSLGLLIIVLLLLAVLAIIVVLGLFQYFIGGSGGRQ